MKNYFFGLIATVLLLTSNLSNAQSDSKAKFPYGCRTWTVGINVVLFSATAEVTLCCSPANWKSPPITCVEMDRQTNSSTGNVYQYIMINELEANIKKKIEASEIEVSSESQIKEDGINYQLKKGLYPIEKNEKNERFVKVLFQRI